MTRPAGYLIGAVAVLGAATSAPAQDAPSPEAAKIEACIRDAWAQTQGLFMTSFASFDYGNGQASSFWTRQERRLNGRGELENYIYVDGDVYRDEVYAIDGANWRVTAYDRSGRELDSVVRVWSSCEKIGSFIEAIEVGEFPVDTASGTMTVEWRQIRQFAPGTMSHIFMVRPKGTDEPFKMTSRMVWSAIANEYAPQAPEDE